MNDYVRMTSQTIDFAWITSQYIASPAPLAKKNKVRPNIYEIEYILFSCKFKCPSLSFI